jgi:hypothetical protein
MGHNFQSVHTNTLQSFRRRLSIFSQILCAAVQCSLSSKTSSMDLTVSCTRHWKHDFVGVKGTTVDLQGWMTRSQSHPSFCRKQSLRARRCSTKHSLDQTSDHLVSGACCVSLISGTGSVSSRSLMTSLNEVHVASLQYKTADLLRWFARFREEPEAANDFWHHYRNSNLSDCRNTAVKLQGWHDKIQSSLCLGDGDNSEMHKTLQNIDTDLRMILRTCPTPGEITT